MIICVGNGQFYLDVWDWVSEFPVPYSAHPPRHSPHWNRLFAGSIERTLETNSRTAQNSRVFLWVGNGTCPYSSVGTSAERLIAESSREFSLRGRPANSSFHHRRHGPPLRLCTTAPFLSLAHAESPPCFQRTSGRPLLMQTDQSDEKRNLRSDNRNTERFRCVYNHTLCTRYARNPRRR